MTNLTPSILRTYIQKCPYGSYQGVSWEHLDNGNIQVSYQLADSTNYSITANTPIEAAFEIMHRIQEPEQTQHQNADKQL